MELVIPKEMTWNVPAGTYRAQLIDVREITFTHHNQTKPQARFIFELEVPSITRKQPMAGQNYDTDLRPNSPLRLLLESWKGKQWVEDRAGQRFNIKELIGEKVILELYHKRTQGHQYPLVLIRAVYPDTNN